MSGKNHCTFAIPPEEARAQQQAGLLIWKLKQKQITRGQILAELELITDDAHKERVRKYLNEYRGK